MGTAAEKSVKKKATSKVTKPELSSEIGADCKASMCGNCGGDARSRRRAFSEQAWTVLLLWNEINPAAVDQPICEDCYQEMREILIDRNDEIEVAMQQSEEVAKIKQRLGNIAS